MASMETRYGIVHSLHARKYSEIVWLPMGRDASTSTNADVLTGLPNTYACPAMALPKEGARQSTRSPTYQSFSAALRAGGLARSTPRLTSGFAEVTVLNLSFSSYVARGLAILAGGR